MQASGETTARRTKPLDLSTPSGFLVCTGAPRKANLVHKANGWKHQKRIAQISRAHRMRLTLSQKLTKLDADWPRVFGEALLEHLLNE